MAKYGSFKYSNNQYGKSVVTGNANISPYNAIDKNTRKSMGISLINIAGIVNLIKTFLCSVGNGSINISSEIIRRIEKFKISSDVGIMGLFSRKASFNKSLFREMSMSGNANKRLFVNITAYITSSKTFSRIANLKRTSSGEITITGEIKKGIFSNIISTITSSSTFSRIASFKRISTTKVPIEGSMSRAVTFRKKVGEGVSSIYSTTTRIVEIFVGYSSSFTYGSFKYGERKYTMNTWIHGSISKHSTRSTGDGDVGINKILNRITSLLSGLGNVPINKLFSKYVNLFSGKGSVTPIKFFQRVATFKRNTGNGSVNIFKVYLKRLHYYFLVTLDNILLPLGVRVTGDSRHELLPSTRDSVEEIPGRHGEIDFGTELKSRLLELDVATDEGHTPIEKSHLQRLFAKYLNPTKGYKPLIFSDDDEKTYMVKYSGKIDVSNFPTWFKFVLPFKMGDPFIIGSFEKTLVGSGTLINDGTTETGLIIEINGPATNPTIAIGGETLKYTGTISNGQKLIIDTSLETAKIGSSNAMANYDGSFPLLYPGETSVTAPSNVSIRWRDKWI